MLKPRFGELLGRLVHISSHDVEEILNEQNGSHRKFGDIALSWGLCQPEHVLSAWCEQLVANAQTADLDTIGVDSQAAEMIEGEVATRLCAIPIRCLGQQLIVAVADGGTDVVAAELQLITGKRIHFVQCEAHQLRRAIGNYYSVGSTAA